MTPIEKAAREAAEEITQDEAILLRVGIPKSTKKNIILRHLAPVQAEIESRREESAKLEKLVEALSKAAPNCKGAPDPIDHGTACLVHLVEQLSAKDKLLREARVIVKAYSIFHKEGHGKRCKGCMAENWLSRLSKNE